MIEIVYKDEKAKDKSGDKIKTPKNIRQVGNCNSKKKIYVEDRIMTYLKTKPEQENILRYGILLGEEKNNSGCTYIYVNGFIQAVSNPVNEVRFNDSVWAQLYEDMRTHYKKTDIVGWYLSLPYKSKDDFDMVSKNHLDNFAGGSKVCFLSDRTENEENFYIYENGKLSKQGGYYIYFEKNDEVEKYIKTIKVDTEPPKEKVRTSEGSFRAMINKKDNLAKYNGTLVKAGAVVATAAMLVTAITAINSYGDIQKLNGSFDKLTSAVLNQGASSEPSGDETVVEVAGSSIEPTTKGEKETKESTDEVPEETTAGEETTQEEETTLDEAEETTEASEEVTYYTVKDGETLFGICMKIYNNANMLEELQEANGLDDDYTIYEGQKIVLP